MLINKQSNLLLVSGTGQNTGKTTFLCSLIERFVVDFALVAVKISPHFHKQEYRLPVMISTSAYKIEQEIYARKGKDSSRFLAAGANKVYYITSEPQFVGEAMNLLIREVGNDVPILCESGGLSAFIKPALHIMLMSADNKPWDNASGIKGKDEVYGSKKNYLSEYRHTEADRGERISGTKKKTPQAVFDALVGFDGESFSPDLTADIIFEKGTWQLR